VDLAAFRANLREMAEVGFKGVVVAGGTGELYSLTPDEVRDLYRAAVEEVGERLTVIAGVGFAGVGIAAELARDAEAAGCHGILILPPSYGAAEQDGLYAYYRTVAEATALGVFPYARGQAIPTPGLLARLAEVPNIVAFKDGHGDLRLWAQLRERVGVERLVWLGGMGDDLVVPYFAAGAQGFTSSVANYDPQTALDLFGLVSGGRFAEAERLLRERGVYAAYEMRARRKGHEVSVVKAAMELAGRPAGPVRPPLLPLTPAEREELAGIMHGARESTLATTA
jgi:5-dehydro-4-deoxyglucarate dehydratase